MNTECMYVLKEKTIEAAKEFAVYLEDLATRRSEEVLPTYISIVTEEFRVTSDYDGFRGQFKVKPGDVIVWAYGKDYCMYRLRPKGARRAFPYYIYLEPNNAFEGRVKDLFKMHRNKDYKIDGFVEIREDDNNK